MFRVSFFVDDKNLALVMRNLSGLARDLQCVPVHIPAPPTQSDGKLPPRVNDFIEELKKRKIQEFDTPLAKEVVAAIGASANSYSYFVNTALKGGVLKKKRHPTSPNGFMYMVQS